MNVGEWLAAQLKPKHDPGAYIGIDDKPMVEIAPHCYLNLTAYEEGYGQSKPRIVSGEYIQNVPIGNSLTPWREWLSEHDGWRAKRSWE
jgi:hypothetical protein